MNISFKKIYDEIYYFFYYRFVNPFHIVKLPRLKKRYYDIDQRMLHANFSLLVEYVEKETPFETIKWDDDINDDDGLFIANEIWYLYNWWKYIYPTYDEYIDLKTEDLKDEIINKNLKRLIEIRENLWT